MNTVNIMHVYTVNIMHVYTVNIVCHICVFFMITAATNVDQYGRPMVYDPVPPTYNRPLHGK